MVVDRPGKTAQIKPDQLENRMKIARRVAIAIALAAAAVGGSAIPVAANGIWIG